jgi:hypothetical protein
MRTCIAWGGSASAVVELAVMARFAAVTKAFKRLAALWNVDRESTFKVTGSAETPTGVCSATTKGVTLTELSESVIARPSGVAGAGLGHAAPSASCSTLDDDTPRLRSGVHGCCRSAFRLVVKDGESQTADCWSAAPRFLSVEHGCRVQKGKNIEPKAENNGRAHLPTFKKV